MTSSPHPPATDFDSTKPLPPLPIGSYAPPSGPSYPLSPPKPGRKRPTGAVALALVAGALAGFGGAAGYDALNPAPTAVQGGPITAGETKSTAAGQVEKVAAQVLPSVVRIDASAQGGAGGLGSGVILSEDGTILTNHHVINAAGADGQLRVTFHDGTHADVEVVGSDPLTDTAVIRALDVSNLQPIAVGKSADLNVGQEVVAVGSPFGLDATVTSGIVSALGRPVNIGTDLEGNVTAYPAIQTDAAINPGNSGGPLVDTEGQLVGLNSSIRTAGDGGESGSIGLGFAIPIDSALPIVNQILDGETPTHARLGIQLQTQSTVEGAVISEVTAGSAADKAGLEPGDVITDLNEWPVVDSESLIATIRSFRPGDTVTVGYTRNGEETTVEVALDSDAP